jgi:signal transduction histidine kinase
MSVSEGVLVSGPQPAAGRYARLRPANWTLPVKLAAVLVVPIVLVLVLGALLIADFSNQASAVSAGDRFMALEADTAGLVDQLEAERVQAAVFVQDNRGDAGALRDRFAATDTAVHTLTAAVGDPASLGGAASGAWKLREGLIGLGGLRNQVTGTGTDAAGVIAGYTEILGQAVAFEASLDRQLSSEDAMGLAAGLAALTEAREQVALQHAVIATAITRQLMLPADGDAVRAADARLGSAVDQFWAALDEPAQLRFGGWITGPANLHRQELKQTALSRLGGRGQLGIAAAEWDQVNEAVLGQMHDSGQGLRSAILDARNGERAEDRNRAGIYSVILLLALLATGAVVYLIGRSMLRPLRVLRDTAMDVAERRLPKAVEGMRAGEAPDVHVRPTPVTTLEEFGQVARAFDAVHGQAVRLAAEQAALQTGVRSMFVNLSRRSQGLVERQLKLIEQLERNEQDSEQLANLFQLDHLATRMRRNSESLLVLAGSDAGRRGGQQVPLVDVLRAAVSEIDQYQRVVVQQPPRVDMVGRAAGDVVHLVAELLENATNFSPPQTQVVVSATRLGDREVVVEIADQGIGMPADELALVNDRLAGQGDVDVAASRRMGLFVVGRLAARHSIQVRLAGGEPSAEVGGGITATVTVPAELIAAGAGEDSTEQADSLVTTALPGGKLANGAAPASGFFTPNGPAEGKGIASGPGERGGSPGLPRRSAGAAVSGPNGTHPADPRGGPPPRVLAGQDPPDAGSARTHARGAEPSQDRTAPAEPPRRGAAASPPRNTPSARSRAAGRPEPANGPSQPTGEEPGVRKPVRPATGGAEAGAAIPTPAEPTRTQGAAAKTGAAAGQPAAEQAADPRRRPGDQRRTPPGGEPRAPSAPRSGQRPSDPPQRGGQPPAGTQRAGAAAPSRRGDPNFDESPIFEEMASAWFRDNWQSGEPEGQATQNPAGRDETADREASGGPGSEKAGASLWGSEAPLLRPMSESEEQAGTTSAGLPKRRPRSNLIPNQGRPAEQPVGIPARSAEQVRGRLASYQQGVRQGRESRVRRAEGDEGRAGIATSASARPAKPARESANRTEAGALGARNATEPQGEEGS